MIYSFFAAAAAACDLILKHRVETLPDSFFPHPLPGSVLTIERHHNYGFSRNRLDDRPGLVRFSVTVLYLIFLPLAKIHQSRSESRMEKFSLALLLGGGLSNLLDRLTRGYVVDYLRFSRKRIRHLIMNLGDLCLFFGTALLFLATLLPVNALSSRPSSHTCPR